MIQIIPAIDIIGGKCVRLTQGDFQRSQQYGDPLEMAIQFEDHGLKRLHLVDLDGTREKKVVNYRILERIALRTTLVIDAGGGLRTDEDVRIVFESGARMVTGGSVAVKEPPVFLEWVRRYGPGKVILGADFKEGRIAVSGWEEDTSLGLMEYLSGYLEKGIRMAICTDISKDGMLQGPSMEVYRRIKKEMPSLFLVASGGIAGVEDVERLQEAGIDGVIIGKALYEKKITLDVIERYIVKNS
jgi:phosphoribosylformimino-5-aminoimidazole carboxamide ribotide isomerase